MCTHSKLYIILIFLSVNGIVTSFAQRAEWVNQVIIVNSGKFEFNPPYQDYVTVQAYDPVTHVVKFFDTIYTQSAQDVIIDGHYAYVAAQDSIIKYDIDSYQRVAAIADSGMSKLCFYNNKLIVSKQYPIKRFFVEILDPNLALLAFVEGISGDCGGISADKDTVFVAVNHGWLGTDGRLAMIGMNNWILKREKNFGTNAIGIWDLYNYGGRINTINKTPYGYPAVGSLTSYYFYTNFYTTNVLNYTIGDGAGIVNNLLYLKVDEGIGSYNLDTQTMVDPSIVPDPGSLNHVYILSCGVDYINDRLYLNIGNRSVNGIGVVTTLTGDSITSFPEGISADCMAVDYRMPVGFSPEIKKDESFTIFPDPVENSLSLKLNGNESLKEIKLIDLTGRTLINKQLNSDDKAIVINCETFSSGIYFVSVKTGDGIKTKKFIKR